MSTKLGPIADHLLQYFYKELHDSQILEREGSQEAGA